jgi:DNA-binding LacI/PurR family transcriptional regulator
MTDLKVHAKAGTPLYVSVKEAVRSAIERGRYQPGEQLPSTKALSDQLEVSLVTVHRAMQELVATGVLRRGQGKGTFVHEEYVKRSAKTHGLRVGLVFHQESSLADSYHGQIMEGVRRQADDLGIDLVLLRFGEDWRNECQGYLYVNPFPEQLQRPIRFAKTTKAPNDGLPIIVVGAKSNRPGVAAVDADNTEIGKAAVAHLAHHGHRRLGFVGGLGTISNDADRWTGFVQGCRDNQIDIVNHAVVRESGWRLSPSALANLVNALRAPDRPTAIFAAGYYFALNVYEAARAANLSIPGQLSVIGVDDPPSATHLSPPLTTFAQPLVKIGRMAVVELADLVVRGERAPQQTTLSAELVPRASVALNG